MLEKVTIPAKVAIKSKNYYEFGEFRLEYEKLRLWRGDTVVQLRPKALEILLLLIESHPRTVLRDEILEKVWNETYVEEGNINFNISLLRKAISCEEWPKGNQIVTVPKEGYRFVADVAHVNDEDLRLVDQALKVPELKILQTVSGTRRSSSRYYIGLAALAFLFITSFGLWRSTEAEGIRSSAPIVRHEEAYRSYLRGRMFFDKRTPEDFDKAAAEFENAIALDPGFALAYSGLSDVYAFVTVPDKPRFITLQNARQAAQKALEIDERLAEAHTSLAWIYRQQDWNWEASERHFKRAIEIDPNYVNARQWYALLLITLGRLDEATVQIDKAREIDPLSNAVNQNYMITLTYSRRYDEILRHLQGPGKLSDDSSGNLRMRAVVHDQLGETAKTMEIVEELFRRNKDRNSTGGKALDARLAVIYARTGRTADSQKLLDSLKKKIVREDAYAAYQLAMAYADLGRNDEALEMLETCLGFSDQRLLWIKVEPKFDPLRGEPRFQAILKKMRLE